MKDPFQIVDNVVDINDALFNVTHGLYILTVALDGKLNGQCLDALMQVSNNPPMIAMGLGKRSLTHEMILKGGAAVVNVIDKEDPEWMEKVKLFGFVSGRDVDKFARFDKYELSSNGAPLLLDAKAFYEIQVLKDLTVDVGTHNILVAKVTRAGVSIQGRPLTYNEYREIKMKRRQI